MASDFYVDIPVEVILRFRVVDFLPAKNAPIAYSHDDPNFADPGHGVEYEIESTQLIIPPHNGKHEFAVNIELPKEFFTSEYYCNQFDSCIIDEGYDQLEPSVDPFDANADYMYEMEQIEKNFI